MVHIPLLSSHKDAAAEEQGEATEQTLPLRPKAGDSPLSVAIHRLPTGDGMLIKVTPPNQPADFAAVGASSAPDDAGTARPPRHVPCDIVLVIDVSGSMGEDAPVPTVEGETPERNGLSVLDLVKHASRTILETLDEGDRLGIVTFATGVKVLQELTQMTKENKDKTHAKIRSMGPENATNLWQGIVSGINLFHGGKTKSGRVPAIMVLTDGLPNFMSPPQGYIPKMRTLGRIPAPIHTFGFGYSLRSGLLKSISEFTGGNYAFIPDAGMIGTVFVHAVANMQSTYANDAVLRLTYPQSVTIEQTQGETVGLHKPTVLERKQQLTIDVGNIQYGQSRDVYLRYTLSPDAGDQVPIDAELEYRKMSTDLYRASTSCNLADGPYTDEKVDDSDFEIVDSPLSPHDAAFHISRSMLCAFLSSLSPLNEMDEHINSPYAKIVETAQLDAFIESLPAGETAHAADPACAALMADVNGQVRMALSQFVYYNRWGRHYLPSLQGAHAAQQCNSFKDPGPLLYASSSPLFIACRDALDTAFDTIPPPEPSKTQRSNVPGGAPPSYSSVSMGRYRNSRGPCFASFCRVTLVDGRYIRVNKLRAGMSVQTPRGPRTVAAVMKTPVSSIPMVTIGRLLITAWHPVSHNGTKWVFPCRDPVANKKTTVRYTGSIYSVLLQPDEDADSHAVNIEGVWVVTLGHGLTQKTDDEGETNNDVRVHRFFGDYSAVCRSMATLDVRKDGLVINGGSSRSNFRMWHTRK
ncbi:von willebrand factor type a domain containing protein [Sporothrix brasiliensis 5110]|uniref:von willebrand factor type a domain containing protein n=1 Tax=Sporothrix brasiliensis 5110 TaxID=1398154 RepID=A0A0C2FHE8_9PEZI|nr:von willebrand factor type a domain containing protein [Sporothrix brasiliensis 5110]KIH90503.1 von willebrand factor type a domain containing protein [Sporothrix brasiliensis 5110]